MSHRILRIVSLLGAILWALVLNPADAQQAPHAAAITPQTPVSLDPARNPPATLGEALRQLTARSGVVFLGRVEHIDRQPGVVTVTLQVLTPISGNVGAVYTLREWAGLWTLGRARYTVGQRALFFLHPPRPSGFSSPVDGQFGVIPLLPVAGQPPQLDARWLATRLVRPSGATLAAGTISLDDARTVITQARTAAASAQPLAEPTLHPLPAALASLTPGAAR